MIEVIDYSDPHWDEHVKVTQETLEKIGAGEIPIVYVYNKAELVLDKLPLVDGDELYLSVKENRGMNELIEVVTNKLFSKYKRCKMKIPFSQGSVVSYLNEHANVMSTDYDGEGTILNVECKESQYNKYHEYVIENMD